MTDRSTVRLLIALALAGYGLYAVAFVPALLVRPPELLLLVAFVLQAGCALAAAVGVARDERWASSAVVLLGVIIAVTWLIEGFVFAIVGWLYALLVAVLAIVIALVIVAYLGRRPGLRID